MKYRALKYSPVFISFSLGFLALALGGFWTFSLPLYAFGVIPLLELLFHPDEKNMGKAEAEVAKSDRIYDWLLYLVVPLQYGLLAFFLYLVTYVELSPLELIGSILTMGIACGAFGINVAHELGHRHKKEEQTMAKMLLLTSLYMHFFIEHNRGHHKNVSTHEDPATSRKGEILYFFWIRSIVGSFIHAWQLENQRLRKKGLPAFSLRNEMLQYQLIQGALVAGIGFGFGWLTLLYFLGAATIGFLLLETVNYIEHYGLVRDKIKDAYYESVRPEHSWNSNHLVGRMMLFELSRHSDHHYRASRPYQVLRHMEGSPQMPTGYPGMIILSLFPPLWFSVMHRQIRKYKEGDPQVRGMNAGLSAG